MSNEQLSQELAVNPLTETEQKALRYWQNANQPEIAPDTAARMFQLFLQGRTCDQIRQLNRGYSLGQIVRARVVGEWDRLKDDYQRDLLELARMRAMNETLETTVFVTDLLAAARIEFGDKLRKAMLSGSDEDRAAIGINSLKDLKEAVQLLQILTGQDKKTKVEGEIFHKHENTPPSKETAEVLTQQMAPAVAAEVLKLLGKKATQRA